MSSKDTLKIKSLFFLSALIGFSLFSSARLFADSPPELTQDERFTQALERTRQSLIRTTAKRPFKLKATNDSLDETLAALRGLKSQQNPQETLSQIENAIKLCEDNYFAILLKGILVHQIGRHTESHLIFQTYLDKTYHDSQFDNKFINPMDYHELRRGVYEFLKSEGLSPSLKPSKLLKSEERSRQGPLSLNEKVHRTFILILLVCGLIFFLQSILGTNTPDSSWPALFRIYRLFWGCYMVYIVGDLKGFDDRWGTQNLILVSLLVLPLGMAEACLKSIWGNYGPVEKDCQRCFSCRRIFSKLLVECPHCKTHVNEK